MFNFEAVSNSFWKGTSTFKGTDDKIIEIKTDQWLPGVKDGGRRKVVGMTIKC